MALGSDGGMEQLAWTVGSVIPGLVRGPGRVQASILQFCMSKGPHFEIQDGSRWYISGCHRSQVRIIRPMKTSEAD